MAQLMVMFTLVCKHILNLGQKPVNFILDYMTFIIKLAFAVNSAPTSAPEDKSSFGALQDDILQQLPTSLYDSMQQLNLDGKTVLYAVCPSCHHLHAPIISTTKGTTWVDQCENTVVGIEGRSPCLTSLLDCGRPIKPFLSPSLLDYLARLLSNPRIETLIEQSCINAMKWKPTPPDNFVDHTLHAQFMQGFEGPVKDVLFINREGRLPIVLSASVDYYPPRGSTIHSSSASIGVMKVSCENLPVHERNEPENVHVSILPGPQAPKGEHINPYLRPVIDIAVAGWERGIHLSRTAKHSQGRTLDLAIPLSINDTPAARQISGMANHNHTIYCTCCECRGRATVYNTDFSKWKQRSVSQLRKAAEDWRDADTIAERKAIYREYGVRWSEMWRLPYWDPTRMLVPDPMHVVLEGVVHYHCRRVLQIDVTLARKRDPAPVAFEMDWLPITPATMARAPAKVVPKLEGDRKKVASVQRLLQREIDDPDPTADLVENEAGTDEEDGNSDDSDDDSDEDMPRGVRPAKQRVNTELFTTDELIRKLGNYTKPVLVWVCWTLSLRAVPPKPPKPPREPRVTREQWDRLSLEESLYWKTTTKAALIETLMNWVSFPLRHALNLDLIST